MRLVFLLFAYIFGISMGYAQRIKFEHIGLDEGLSQISVNTIYEDEFGRMWIGTRDGLNLFDGNRIRYFFPQRGDTTGLLYNHIGEITGDKKGSVYIKSQGALTRFDLKLEKFNTLIRRNVMAISYSNNSLLIATRQELLRYRPETGKTDTLYSQSTPFITSDIHEDTQHNIWLATENGIFRLDRNGVMHTEVSHVKTTRIYEDSRNHIWIGTWEHGAYIFDPDLNVENLKAETLHSNFVRDICEDDSGYFWVGTFNGLGLYDPEQKKIVAFYNGVEKGGTLSHSSIWCIIKDHQGSIWMGTYFGGINYFNPAYNFYQYYVPEEGNRNSLSSPIIGKMVEDRDHRLWICTEGGGLNCFDRQEKTFKSYRHQPGNPYSISHNNLKSIWYDEKKDLLWIGTHTGGLNRFDMKSETFRTYKHDRSDPYSIAGDIVRDIVPYKDQLLLATYNGVCLFDPETGRSVRLFEKEKYGYDLVTVIDLLFDSNNTLWISVGGEGIFSYNFTTDKLKHYRYEQENPNSINSLVVNCIFQDHKGRLWFGTAENGLNLYRPETDDFISFNKQNSGMLSNHISGILESRYGYLLIASGQGFTHFDTAHKLFRNYSRRTGFPLSTINDGAAYITADGEIFLGGISGLVSFYESKLDITPKPYTINLERLVVNNQEIRPNDESGILKESILMSDRIKLNHGHNVFTIEFAATNHIPLNWRELEYRLVGFNDKWIDTESRKAITYTNLDPGQYTLEIREKDYNDQEAAIYRSITIDIAPPLYRTWYALLLYIAISILIVWWLLLYLQTRTKLKLEQNEKMQIEDLNQKKLRFFTNVSHEFRTPISLIMGQAEMLMETPNIPTAAYNRATSIYRNSRKMNELISELIDFRKQEQGYMKLKVSKQDIVSFVYEFYSNFKENAGRKKFKFNFHSSIESIEIWFDKSQLQKVINNLLNNAFKFTPEGGEIDVFVNQTGKHVEIRVKDSGVGISKSAREKVFERFYQDENQEISRNNPGSGIGLALAKGIIDLHKGAIRVESEEGKGSEFIVTLPIENQFSKEEISTGTTLQPDPSYTGMLGENDLEEIESNPPEGFNPQEAKIFIVEDNNDLREMLVNIFAPIYEVQSAADGENAFETIREWQPDIILSDIMMPKISGTELCIKIKSNFETSHIPIILLTAQTGVEQNIEGLRIGADDYITKPFNVKILISRCNNLINNRRMLQEKFSRSPSFSAQITATNALDKGVIEKAQRIVEKYIDDSSFDVNVFAREMALGRTKLFAKIKGITGQTPNEFIQTIKLKKAAHWLKNNPELSIADITYSLGFSSPRYFSKCFKDAFGIAPNHFRNEKGEKETG